MQIFSVTLNSIENRFIIKSKWEKSKEVIDTAFEVYRCGNEQPPRVTGVWLVRICAVWFWKTLEKGQWREGAIPHDSLRLLCINLLLQTTPLLLVESEMRGSNLRQKQTFYRSIICVAVYAYIVLLCMLLFTIGYVYLYAF